MSRLSAAVISVTQKLAKQYDLPASNLLAVIDVEAAGRMFSMVNGKKLPTLRFEGHIFYRKLSGAQRDQAVKLGLAHPKRGRVKNPRSQAARWALLRRAQEINEDAALESASYGGGQVMGFNWNSLGYVSVQEFVASMSDGIEGQIEAMIRFIFANNLDDDLRAGRWSSFARGYNGVKYRENRYHIKLAAAAAFFGGGGVAVAVADGMLRIGSRGARVRELQALLNTAGHPVVVDGDFGPATRKALIQFQRARDIIADGVYGPETVQSLTAHGAGFPDNMGEQKVHEIDAVQQGAGGVGVAVAVETGKRAIQDALTNLEAVDITLPFMTYLTTGLTIAAAALAVVGVIWAVRGFLQSRQTVEV